MNPTLNQWVSVSSGQGLESDDLCSKRVETGGFSSFYNSRSKRHSVLGHFGHLLKEKCINYVFIKSCFVRFALSASFDPGFQR